MRLAPLAVVTLFFSLSARAAVRITIQPPTGTRGLPAHSDTRRIAEQLLGPGVDIRQDAATGAFVLSAPSWNEHVAENDRAGLLGLLEKQWGKGRVVVEQALTTGPAPRANKLPAAEAVLPAIDVSATGAVFDGRSGSPTVPAIPVAPPAHPGDPFSREMLQSAAERTGAAATDLDAIIRIKEWAYRRMDGANVMGLFDRASELRAARELGLDAGRRGEKLAGLVKNPETNIQLGARLWTDLVAIFHGNKDRALLAWYAGAPAYTPAWRSIALDPQMRAVLAQFHRFAGGTEDLRPRPNPPAPTLRRAPVPERRPQPAIPSPMPRPAPTIPLPAPPPQAPSAQPPFTPWTLPQAPAGEPIRPQGRYWTQAEVEEWIRFYNARDFHWSEDFLKFVKAILFTESPYWSGAGLYADTMARSPTGPRGIAQFTWETGKFYGLIRVERDARGRARYVDYRFDAPLSIHACMSYLRDLAAGQRRADYISMMNRVAAGYNVGEGQYYVRKVHSLYCSFGGEAACYGRRY